MSRSQYFEEHPDVASDPLDVDVLLPDVCFTMTTDRGVFSRGSLDAGTRLLLSEQLPLPEFGNLLDLGCGSGAIAVTMAMHSPRATVWGVDVNERALALTAANAARAGATNVRACTPASVPTDIRFDTIWSNPPIRVGKAALHDLLSLWLARLTLPDGEAMLVVQKHLGSDSLATWLCDVGWPTERIRSRAGYRLLRVRHPTHA